MRRLHKPGGLSNLTVETGVVKHLRNYYFLTTFHCPDLTHYEAFCLDLARMKMSRGHYKQNSECRDVLETRHIARQKEASHDP